MAYTDALLGVVVVADLSSHVPIQRIRAQEVVEPPRIDAVQHVRIREVDAAL
jgi:hypothetical protein